MIKDFPIEIIDQILEDIHVGLTLVGTDGKILWFNKLATELLGWDEQQTNSVLKCHKQEMHQQIIHKINNCKLKREWHRTIKIKGRIIENTYSPICIPERISGVMIITRDVTEREQMYQVIKKAAITDALTGLYNRKFLDQICADFASEEKPFGVMMLDINGLKYVNDHYGHEVGDQLIIKAANIIRSNVRQSDYVFRFGGDEFLVLLPEIKTDVLNKIKQRIKEQNQLPSNEQPTNLYLSVGVCSSSEFNRIQDVISCADKEMYADKHRFYENEGKALLSR